MEQIELLTHTGNELTVRHRPTGPIFTYRINAACELETGLVFQGPGAQEPRDVAADVRVVAKREARRLGLI
jgi:hypothetical protein